MAEPEGIREMPLAEHRRLTSEDYPGRPPSYVRRRLQSERPEYYSRLREHIREHGVQLPVLLAPNRYAGQHIENGTHRWAIANELGLPVRVGDWDNPEHRAYVENHPSTREWESQRRNVYYRTEGAARMSAWYHGTTHEFAPGQMLTTEGAAPHHHENIARGWLHFTDTPGRAADYAGSRAEDYGGRPHVYQVEPSGPHEQDPGDGWPAERTRHPVRIVRELPEHEWDDYEGEDDGEEASVAGSRQAAAEMLDLYHHTYPETADRIRHERRFLSNDDEDRVYFTNAPGSASARDFGDDERGHAYGVVHVRMPRHLVNEWPGGINSQGEAYYDVARADIQPEHVLQDDPVRHTGHLQHTADSDVSDYGIGHRPLRDGAPAHDLHEGYAEDVYTHPQYYGQWPDQGTDEGLEQLRRVRGKPDAPVTIYRASGPGTPREMNPGDWVSLSRSYAHQHAYAESGSDDPAAQYHVHKAVVPARHVRDAGTDQYREQGYWGPTVPSEPDEKPRRRPWEFDASLQKAATGAFDSIDWDEIHPDIGDIHRGIGVTLPDELHRHVHDQSVPAAERASALLRHLGDPDSHGYRGAESGLGSHWSMNPSVAEDYAEKAAEYQTEHENPSGREWGSVPQDQEHGVYTPPPEPGTKPGTAVVFHAHPPEREDIDEHAGDMGGVYHPLGHGEEEIPLHGGASVHVKGISWAPVHHWRDPRSFDGPQYEHHDFPGGTYHSAVRTAILHGRDELPPDPGTAPIPHDHIRLWHYTSKKNIDSIREHGLQRSYARGDAGDHNLNDPSAGVWASTKRPDEMLNDHSSHAAVVEYHAHPSEISGQAEEPWHAMRKDRTWDNDQVQDWAKGHHHVIMRGDVHPSQIVAVHEPWHGAARYIRDDPAGPESYDWVREEHAKGNSPELEPYVRGLDALQKRGALERRPSGHQHGGWIIWPDDHVGEPRCSLCGHRTKDPDTGHRPQQTRELPVTSWPGEILDRARARRQHVAAGTYVVYHGAHHDDVPSIQREGLRPARHPDDATVATSREGAALIGHMRDWTSPRVLEFRIPAGQVADYLSEPREGTPAEGTIHALRRPLPPSMLAGIHEASRRTASAPPLLPNPHTGGSEWFHGTQAHKEDLSGGFMDPAAVAVGAYEIPQDESDDSGHWNRLLGTHFTADHDIASEFARGEHHSSDNDGYGDWDEREEHQGVVHARLHLKNPRVYDSEHHMDHEAYEHEHAAGNHPINHLRDYEDDKEYGEEMRDEAWPNAMHIHRDYGTDEIPASVYGSNYGPFGGHPMRTAWLNTHPDKWGIADRFKKRLQAQGHDGVIYRNEYEKTLKGKHSNTSAIVFHPDQAEITQHHHADEPCEQHRTAAWTPSDRIFGPTYGLDHRLFTRGRLRPRVRRLILARVSSVLAPLLGPEWESFTRVYLAGSEASEWTGPDREGNGDFDTLIGFDFAALRRAVPAMAGKTDLEIADEVNHLLARHYNEAHWHPAFLTGPERWDKEWDLTGYCNTDAWDITEINPYAAWDITSGSWAVRPPHLPDWSPDQFPEGPAIFQAARALIRLVRATLMMPEPFRTDQARAIWSYIHEGRSRDFSAGGLGWQGPGNVLEKALDQAPGQLVERLKAVAYGEDPAQLYGPGALSATAVILTAATDPGEVYYHGTPDVRNWEHGADYGIHIGTHEAARQALEARIGRPAEGTWDGTREYGKTLLNRDVRTWKHNPETGDWDHEIEHREPSYPDPEEAPGYSGGARVPMDARPHVFPVRIKGPMTNRPETPHADFHANGYMHGQIKRGRAKSGYYYRNVSEDEGSISAVVPSAAHLKRLEGQEHQAAKSEKPTKTKEQVSYRYETSGSKTCGTCVMFRLHPPDFDPEAGACTLVKGLIDEEATCDEWYPQKKSKTAAGEPPWMQRGVELRAEHWDGEDGNRSHMTHRETGWLPTAAVERMRGLRGERPGEHRNRQGQDWDDWSGEVGRNGIRNPIYITVDHGESPRISEGNHRRDAAVRAGHARIPVEITYFGNAQKQGTVWERHLDRQRTAAARVEHVRVDALLSHREWEHGPGWSREPGGRNGVYAPRHTPEEWAELRRSIAEEGVREPVRLRWDPKTNRAYVGEGNSRLTIAHELGHETIPAAAGRSSWTPEGDAYQLAGQHRFEPGQHIPADLSPSDFLPASYFPGQHHEAAAGGWPAARSKTLYHGTTADLQPGDHIEPGHQGNWEGDQYDFGFRRGEHVFATHNIHHAWDFAEHARVKSDGGEPHVYEVEPTGRMYVDPEVLRYGTPDHPAYQSRHPLRVVRRYDHMVSDDYKQRARAEAQARHLEDLHAMFGDHYGSRTAAAGDYRYEHLQPESGRVHWVNAYHPDGHRVGDMTWHAHGDHHVTWIAVYDEDDRRKGIATGMWNKAREVDPQVRHNTSPGGQTDAGRSWARTTSGRREAAAEGYTTCEQGHRHWGHHGAAGLLIRHQDDDGQTRYLLQKRAPWVQEGGTWSTPGGALHKGEPPASGARREAEEELGGLPRLQHSHTVTDDHGGWAYHTVVADAPEQFQPGGDGSTAHETAGHGWFTAAEMKGLPLHSGFARTWDTVRRSRTDKLAAFYERGDLGERSFYHASPHAFQPGDYVEPGHEPANSHDRQGHVFMTTDRDNAVAWAEHGAGGGIYRVEEPPDYEDDPIPTGEGEYRTRHPLRVLYREAGLKGELPEGLTFEHRESGDSPPWVTHEGGTHTIIARHPSMPFSNGYDNHAGHITWWDDDGEIAGIGVSGPMQRRGLATELLRRAREITPHVRHSPLLSRDGRDWVSGIGEHQAAARSYRLWRGEGGSSGRVISPGHEGLWFTPDRIEAENYAYQNSGHLYHLDVTEADRKHITAPDVIWDGVRNGGAVTVHVDPELAARKEHHVDGCPSCDPENDATHYHQREWLKHQAAARHPDEFYDAVRSTLHGMSPADRQFFEDAIAHLQRGAPASEPINAEDAAHMARGFRMRDRLRDAGFDTSPSEKEKYPRGVSIRLPEGHAATLSPNDPQGWHVRTHHMDDYFAPHIHHDLPDSDEDFPQALRAYYDHPDIQGQMAEQRASHHQASLSPDADAEDFRRHMTEMHGKEDDGYLPEYHEGHARDHEDMERAQALGLPLPGEFVSHSYQETEHERRRGGDRMPDASRSPGHIAIRRWDHQSAGGVYLRFGDWPADERSRNNVTGRKEDGVSVYDLDRDGDPEDPDPGYERGHHHDESCDPDCDLDWENDDYGNDPGEEMDGRIRRAERGRRTGDDRRSDTAHLVRGDMVSLGHDAEPLLRNVRRVGDWIDHRHLFIPGAEKHRLAREPGDEGYEPPAEKLPGHRRQAGTSCSCCGGTGEHATGHECYRCDASGQSSPGPDCEEVYRDPAAHAQGCPAGCGQRSAARKSREELTPGMYSNLSDDHYDRFIRPHFEAREQPGSEVIHDSAAVQYHSSPFSSGFPHDDWSHVGTRKAAEDRLAEINPVHFDLSRHTRPTLYHVKLSGRVYPHVLTDEQAGDISSTEDPHVLTEHDLPSGRGYHIFPYRNHTEDIGSVSYLAHKSAIRVLRAEQPDDWRYEARKTAAGKNGMMIALIPADHVKDHLQQVMEPLKHDAEPREDLHVTVLYLGKTTDRTQAELDKLPELIRLWAKTQEPFTASVQGSGTFANSGEHPLLALVDIPGEARHMHNSLADFLKGHGISFPENHSWIPHITLAYSPHAVRFLPKIERREWPVSEVHYFQGGARTAIPLGR